MLENRQIQIFIAYSRKDKGILEELRTHLKSLERTLNLKVWFDGQIELGENWEQSIKNNLNNADIVLLLISQNFIASEYCYSKEMHEALQLHKKGKLKVIPVIAKECLWEDSPFSHLQGLPKEAKPIESSTWETPNRPYLEIVTGLKNTITQILSVRKSGFGSVEPETKLIIQMIDFKYGKINRKSKNKLVIFNGHTEPVYIELLYLKHQTKKYDGPTFMLNEIIPANSIKEIISPQFRHDDTVQESWEMPKSELYSYIDTYAGIIQTTNTNFSRQGLNWESERWESGDPKYVNAIVSYLIGTKKLYASTLVLQGFSFCKGNKTR